MKKEIVYSVSEFSMMVKNYLEGNDIFREFFIEGEMSNVVYYKSGHLYFQIKDKNSQLRCAAFNYKMKRIPDDLKEGDSVKIFGDVGFYEVRGEFQILVRHIEKKNVLGELFAKLEKVKKEMASKGYFDPSHKRPLPKYPQNIGVVTALSGAAVQDIIKTIKKRDDTINIYVYPAKVQGEGAKEEIVSGIKRLNEIPDIDLIIAGRGGGSIEDLWAFNEKEVAMAFYESQKPIISAVGHEIDYLLSDMTADARAATPTQAVEMSVPERQKTIEELKNKEKYMKTLYLKYLDNLRTKLELRKNNYNIKNFIKIIDTKRQLLVEKENKTDQLVKGYILAARNKLEVKLNRIISLNPLNVLKRGYSIVTGDNKIIRTINDVKINGSIEVRITDGTIKSIVKETVKDKGVVS